MTWCLEHAPVGPSVSNVVGGNKTTDSHLLEFSHLMRRIPRPKIGSELSMGVQSHGTAGAGSRDQYVQGSLYGSHHPWTATRFRSDSHGSLYNWNSELFSVIRSDDLSLATRSTLPSLLP